MNNKKNFSTTLKIPKNISVIKKNEFLLFSGPLGETALNLKKIDSKGLAALSISQQNQTINLVSNSKSFHGLLTAILNNKIQGVSRGFLLYFKIIGIGYRVSLQKNTLFFKLGYSHDIVFKLPSSVKVFLIDPTLFCLFGIDKNQVTQIAAKIRNLRKPSVYKGKGIRLLDEKISLKVGKRK